MDVLCVERVLVFGVYLWSDPTFSPPVSVLHRDAEEEAFVMETTGPEAVPVHAEESSPGHHKLPATEEVKTGRDTESFHKHTAL